jgi:hypothetical protein
LIDQAEAMEVQKVRSTYRVHCARGVNRGCQKCINEKAKGVVYELIEPDSNEEGACRMIEQFTDGKETWMQEYRVVREFASKEEALEFAEKNNIKDIKDL